MTQTCHAFCKLEIESMCLVRKICAGETPLNWHAGSIPQDIEAGGETEFEAMTGYVVRKAREVGVPAPVTESVYRIAKVRGIRGPSETRTRLERVAVSHGSGCTMKFFSPETKTVRPSGVIPIARNSPGRSGSVIPVPISLNTPLIGFVRS